MILSVQTAMAAPFAAFVMDARNGEVLLSQNADTRLHPASLTKMMTLYIAFQAMREGHMSLDTVVTVTANAANQAPSRLGLKRGQKIQMRYLVRAAAIKSANDAAAAIGDHIAGSEAEFAKLMNRTAKNLGMNSTTFKNAHGLTAAGHLSTARDMSILGRHLLYDFPEFYNLFSRRSADAGVATVRTTNSRFLDAYEGADGIKTGYTSAAGFNLTSSAKRGNKRIIATVFGGTSTAQRNAKVAELLDIGFKKAKNNVKTRVPAAPRFAGSIKSAPKPTPAPTPDADAALVAALVAKGTEAPLPGLPKVAAASVGLTSSPRPKSRPERPVVEVAAAPVTAPEPATEIAAVTVPDDALLAAIQDSVDEALSDVVTPEAEAPVMVAAAGPKPRPRPLREGTIAPAEAVLTEPEAIAIAQATPETTEEPVQVAAAETFDAEPGVVLAGSLRPMPRPVRAAQAEVVIAAAEPEAAQPDTAVVVAEAAPAVAVPKPQLRPADRFTPPPASEAALATELAVAEAPEAVPMLELASAAPRSADPAPARATGIQPEVFAEAPAAPQVVTRLSTSGGRQWGINVGLFGSEYEAERVLLTTALKESATLGKALRKVARSPRGFQANFVGMTEDMATLACSRLQARNIKCSTLSPG